MTILMLSTLDGAAYRVLAGDDVDAVVVGVVAGAVVGVVVGVDAGVVVAVAAAVSKCGV